MHHVMKMIDRAKHIEKLKLYEEEHLLTMLPAVR